MKTEEEYARKAYLRHLIAKYKLIIEANYYQYASEDRKPLRDLRSYYHVKRKR